MANLSLKLKGKRAWRGWMQLSLFLLHHSEGALRAEQGEQGTEKLHASRVDERITMAGLFPIIPTLAD
jgi:hypothetical protein